MLLFAANPHLAAEVRTRPRGRWEHTAALKELARREREALKSGD